MSETAPTVIDARLAEALGQYFNGVTLKKAVGDCAILSGIRKQNGAPVDIYTPSYNVARDDAARGDIAKQFEKFEKLGSNRLQSAERLLTSRAFKKTPSLAMLSCPVEVFDDAFDTRPVDIRLRAFDEVLEGLATLHGAGIVHGNLQPTAVRREDQDGALRLCDFAFCGERATTVTGQPPAYQSRHVIATSQPRLVDDVHAAGMLGYRILLGAGGAEKVLTGSPETDDPEQVVAAILGEETTAPGAAELFPEGHASADQIARLLARMTGRLANSTPFSSADAARKALNSVIDNPNAGMQDASPAPRSAPSPAAPAAAPAMMTAPAQTGISRNTALMIFGGFLISTAAAAYYYVETNSLTTRLGNAARAFEVAKTELFETRDALAEYKEASTLVRQADVAVTEARMTGSEIASDDSKLAYQQAADALRAAIEALDPTDHAAATAAAETAVSAARAAVEASATARSDALTAAAEADTQQQAASLAGAAQMPAFSETSGLLDMAETSFDAGLFAEAQQNWHAAAEAYQGVIAELSKLAQTAKDGALAAKDAAQGQSDQAGYVLANGLMDRAAAAMDGGAFREAAETYNAAASGFTKLGSAPATRAAPRPVTIGDDAAALSAAVGLCLSDAPIAASSCPAARPATEAARLTQILPFEIDAQEISAGDFAQFVQATGYVTEAEDQKRVVALTSSGEARFITGEYSWSTPGGKNTTYQSNPNLPVMNVSMKDASAYCTWANGRLPTEAEWEFAARGDSGAAFPWGAWNAEAPAWRGAPKAERRLPQAVSMAGGATADGIQGLAGNVREWVQSEDGAVLKGGSWNTANPADLRISARLAVPNHAPGVDFGFRCARDAEGWK